MIFSWHDAKIALIVLRSQTQNISMNVSGRSNRITHFTVPILRIVGIVISSRIVADV